MNTERLLQAWGRLGGNPLGRWLFDRLIGLSVPYSGSVRARVRELSPGKARVELRDRRGVRNHLSSIHAIAQANVLELTSGLSMMAALSPEVRGIVAKLEVIYHKKARGLLAEINNGRLAMLGIMAFVAESKVPGSVPALEGKIA
ncbi:MAG: DUF4442 domain-containing protein, partial [Planctomycetes bacterium]|nr:DUF4442 domain-containing protein [Planctomycetota bacterium]